MKRPTKKERKNRRSHFGEALIKDSENINAI
jgi:hypothetical protein